MKWPRASERERKMGNYQIDSAFLRMINRELIRNDGVAISEYTIQNVLLIADELCLELAINKQKPPPRAFNLKRKILTGLKRFDDKVKGEEYFRKRKARREANKAKQKQLLPP
jgi:hypothetical protein